MNWLPIIGGIIAAVATIIIAIAKGLISFGTTSEQTQSNTDKIADLQDDMDNKVDREDFEELKGRVGDLEARNHKLRERVAELEGSMKKL